MAAISFFSFIDIFGLLEPTRLGDLELTRTAKTSTSLPSFITHKLAMAMLTILGISILYVTFPVLTIQSGNYTSLLVVLQLLGASTIIYFLDQVLDYYGICPIFPLFFASNVCKLIFWEAFSPITVNTGRGPEFEGSVISFVHLITSWADKSHALQESIFRRSQPNLITLGSTIFMFIAIIYLQGISTSKEGFVLMKVYDLRFR